MSNAVTTYLHEQAYRLRDFDSNSVDATMLELAAKRIAELEAALHSVMIGGNHLPQIFGVNHPHAGLPHEAAMKCFGPGDKYEAWCCWNAIMLARDVLENV